MSYEVWSHVMFSFQINKFMKSLFLINKFMKAVSQKAITHFIIKISTRRLQKLVANKREISRGVAGVGDNVTWRKVKLTKLPCRGANSVANLWNRAADEATPLSILYRVQGTPREFSELIWWFGQCQWSPGLEIVMRGESYVRIQNRTSIFTNTFRVLLYQSTERGTSCYWGFRFLHKTKQYSNVLIY